MRRAIGLALLTSGCGGNALAWVSPVPDVVVYTQGSLGTAMRDVAARFQAADGVRVKVYLNSSAGLVGLVSHGARADVAVADTATIDALGKLAAPGTRRVVGIDPVVLVARRDAGIGPGDAGALIAAHTVVVTDPTTAASFDGQAALRAVAPRAVPVGVANGPDVIYTILHGAPRLGLLHRSAVVGRSDVAVVAAVPVPPQTIEAALLKNGQSGRAAAFLAFLVSAPMVSVMRHDGLGAAK